MSSSKLMFSREVSKVLKMTFSCPIHKEWLRYIRLFFAAAWQFLVLWMFNIYIYIYIYIYISFTGWEVRIWRNRARGLEYRRGRRPRVVLRPRAQFLPIRTDLGWWITFLFFSYWDLKVSGNFFLHYLSYVCLSRTRSCWWRARSIENQTTWLLAR